MFGSSVATMLVIQSAARREEAERQRRRELEKFHEIRLYDKIRSQNQRLIEGLNTKDNNRVRAIFEEGLYPHVLHIQGDRLFRWAVINAHYELIKQLIKNNVNPHKKLPGLKSPMHLAALQPDGEVLKFLINTTYKHRGFKNKHPKLVQKAKALGGKTVATLANYAFQQYEARHEEPEAQLQLKAIDFELLIKYIFPLAVKNPKKHWALCIQIGNFLFQQNTIIALSKAIAFFTLAGPEAKVEKSLCYAALMDTTIAHDEMRSSLALQFTPEQLLHPSIPCLIAVLSKEANKSLLLQTELAHIYEAGGDLTRACEHYEKAVRLGSIHAIERLTDMAEKNIGKRIPLVKYTAMCYHLGVGDKQQDHALAMQRLENALVYDTRKTLHYLVNAGKELSLYIFKNPEVFSGFALKHLIKLFTTDTIQNRLKPKEKVHFLMYAASTAPYHPWVRTKAYQHLDLDDLPKEMRCNLINIFLVVALLNDDLPHPAMYKHRYLKKMQGERLEGLLAIFSDLDDTAVLEQIRNVYNAYHILYRSSHFPKSLPIPLDAVAARQVLNLLHGKPLVAGKNEKRVKKLIQKTTLDTLYQELAQCESSEEKIKKIEQVKKERVLQSTSSVGWTTLTFFKTPPLKKLDKELKKERKRLAG